MVCTVIIPRNGPGRAELAGKFVSPRGISQKVHLSTAGTTQHRWFTFCLFYPWLYTLCTELSTSVPLFPRVIHNEGRENGLFPQPPAKIPFFIHNLWINQRENRRVMHNPIFRGSLLFAGEKHPIRRNGAKSQGEKL